MESKMIEVPYLWDCQNTEEEKYGWKKLDASGKIKVQAWLGLDQDCMIGSSTWQKETSYQMGKLVLPQFKVKARNHISMP